MGRSSVVNKLLGAGVAATIGYFMDEVIDVVLNNAPLPDSVKTAIQDNKVVKGILAIIAASFVGPTVAGFVSRGAKSWAKLAAMGGAAFKLAQNMGISLPIKVGSND